ncbi:Kidins220 [Symbiodinium natans]|uniref:Kidins220 protein n=1 Tax=Symbiodinium natans TaxID=878477 RepID=A0A812I0D1_9DINO|nr:Kidins220 [Symbiodinium natans]
MKKVAAALGGVWVLGILLGYDYLWPFYWVLDLLSMLLSFPPLSWLASPFSWIFSWVNRGAPMVQQTGAEQELRLPNDKVPNYLDQYVQHYGDAALIFATHSGYPQIVNALLYNQDLGYSDLIDATDENGNTALLYATAKGFRQCTAALLRSGANPDVANQGHGGRTPMMEAAGAGHKDLVAALRLSNATVDAVDDYGNTALHYAAYHGHLSCVHELLKANPRKDIQNSYGHTAASYAASNKFKAIADVLSRAPSKRELAQRAAEEQARMKKADADLEAAEDDEDLGPLAELADIILTIFADAL